MTDESPSKSAPPQRRVITRGRVLIYGMVLLLGGLSLAYVKLTDSSRVSEIARDTLSRMTGAEVRIGGASFELDGVIRLFDVDFRVPGIPGNPKGGDQLFTADQILIQHNMWALATGGLDVQSVSLIRPTFFPTEDVDNGKFTFQYLKPRSIPKKKDKSRTVDLPDLHLSQALVVFGEVADGKYRSIQTVQLNGDLTRQPKETGIYSFALRQTRGDRQFVLSGDFDLYQETMTARMQLGQLMSSDQRIDMLPRQIRNLFQQLKPTGTFPAIQFGYDKERQFNALIEIVDASVNIPWGETELHIENSRGTVGIEKNNRLTVDLKGVARGSNYGADYEIKGTADGFEDDSAFHVQARLRGAIPEEPKDLALLPTAMQTIIKRVSPRGGFDVTVSLEREPLSGQIITVGQVRVIDAALTYTGFPYPLEQLNGTVTFDNERINIEKITGRGPKDDFGRQANVTISGYVIENGARPGVHVSVLSENAPVDRHLRAALDPKDEQQIYDMFFCLPQHEKYINEETGFLQTTPQKTKRLADLKELHAQRLALASANPRDDQIIAQLDAGIERITKLSQRPVFDLGGVARAQVDVRLNPGEKRTYVTVRASAPGLKIAYENWPYPLTFVGDGELIINVPAVNGEVVRVKGAAIGLNGGTVAVDGIMRPPTERGRNLIPELKLTASGLPLDDLLLRSLPPADEKTVRQLGLEGVIDVDGLILNDDQHRIDFRVGVSIKDAKARPNQGDYALEDVAAKLTVHRRGVDLHFATAKHADSTLALTSAPSADGKTAQLTLIGTRMKFEDPLLDLIPSDEPAAPQVRALLNTHKPTGEFDFKLDNLAKINGRTDYRFELTPRKLNLDLTNDLKKERIEISDMRGSAIVTTSQIDLQNIRGDFGTGRFRLDGTIETKGTDAYNLGFDIEAGSYCKVTQTLLPRGAASAINSLKLEGGYRIRDAKLIVNTAATNQPAVKFDAIIHLDEAKAEVGVPLTQMTGDINISVTEQKIGDLPAIDLRLDRMRLRAAERWVDPVSVRITSGDKPGMFNITKLKGEIYGGSLTGSGLLFRQDNTDRYKMEIALQEVALDPFISPTDAKYQPTLPARHDSIRLIGDDSRESSAPPAPAPQRTEPVSRKRTALLSASLAIEGESANSDSKRGRGDLRIRDAALYETQLGLSLLQLLNLSAPVSRSFDKVEATYLIDGDLVHLERIHFDAPNLTITGKGTMNYATLGLDLTMTSANPRGLELGPVTDVLKLLKDELISIRVTGTLTEPKAGIQSLKGISSAVDEVLGKPKEPRRTIPPLRETDRR